MSPFQRQHPDEIHTPVWDADTERPIVDGKYNDPETGTVREASGGQYSGPPAVDIVITNLHQESAGSIYRAQRAFPAEKLLCWIMRVVEKRNLKLDSLVATLYAIRVVLVHELDQDKFIEVSSVMTNGIWDEVKSVQ
ncbi:hypothetical protein FE257_005122 [Aspergillus nanangensis]|uniref:Uncharacterized protein n=1 Tax=Aspergillus nanangensis TaxID=2582783 RepID=A0AAD4CAE9_ASPNN|nr:hypothetical protein FE257_005122 [Aspergillus nanangensis]